MMGMIATAMPPARRVPPEKPAPANRVERMKKRLRANVARNVLRIRTDAGLSQKQLSERANLSQTYVSQIESARNRNFGVDVIAMLAVALDVAPSDLTAD